jgi:hypothetical protein
MKCAGIRLRNHRGRPSETVRRIEQPPERETPIAETW